MAARQISPARRRLRLTQMQSSKHKPTRLQEWMTANGILPSEMLEFMPGEMSRPWFTRMRWTPTGEQRDTALSTMNAILRAARLAVTARGEDPNKVQMSDLFNIDPGNSMRD